MCNLVSIEHFDICIVNCPYTGTCTFFLIVYYDEEDVECNSPSEFFYSLWKCMTSCEWKAVCQDRSNLVALSINM